MAESQEEKERRRWHLSKPSHCKTWTGECPALTRLAVHPARGGQEGDEEEAYDGSPDFPHIREKLGRRHAL